MSQFQNALKIIALAQIVFTVGCAPSSSSSSGGAGASATIAASTSVLDGNWLTACSSSSTSSGTIGASFTDSNYTMSVSAFNGANCSGSEEVTFSFVATYALGSASSSVSGATNISLTAPTTISVTPNTVATATALNTEDFCGLTTWAVNVPQAVSTSSNCVSSFAGDFSGPSNSIFQIVGNNLYFGNDAGTAIDTSTALVKQ